VLFVVDGLPAATFIERAVQAFSRRLGIHAFLWRTVTVRAFHIQDTALRGKKI
jgi:hypothetical protein